MITQLQGRVPRAPPAADQNSTSTRPRPAAPQHRHLRALSPPPRLLPRHRRDPPPRLPRPGLLGHAPSPASATPAPASSSSASPPAPTEPTAPAAPSPATAPATSCTPSSTSSASPANPAPSAATTASSCATPGSPPSSAAPRPATSPPRRRSATAPRISPPRSPPCREVRVVVCLGKIAWDGYLAHLLDAGVIARRSAYTFRHGAEYLLPNGLTSSAATIPRCATPTPAASTVPCSPASFCARWS